MMPPPPESNLKLTGRESTDWKNGLVQGAVYEPHIGPLYLPNHTEFLEYIQILADKTKWIYFILAKLEESEMKALKGIDKKRSWKGRV